MTASTADPFAQFLMTVNPFEIDSERYRTSGAILHETPGCATDRDRQQHWHTDNLVAKHIQENHHLIELERMRQRDKDQQLAQEIRDALHDERLKARTNTGPYSLAGKGET